MKKVFALALALAMALCLCACGGDAESDPNAGLYTCTLTLEGTSETCDWTLDGDAFTVEVEGEAFTGTLADGVLVLDVVGMNMTFEKGE